VILTGNRRGVALMLVLWVLVVLGAIAAGVAALVRAEARALRNDVVRAQARYAAESGVVGAQQELRALLQAAITPREQALVFRELAERLAVAHEQSLGAARFQVTVADLNARVDLNRSAPVILRGLLRQFADERHATALLDALEDWKDGDQDIRPAGAEISQYIATGSPFRSLDRPLQRLDELTRIAGFSDSIARALAPFVTVYGDGRINLNTAPREVLAAIPWLGTEGARMIVSRREGGVVFESPAAAWALFRDAGATGGFDLQAVTTMPRRLLIVSRGWTAGHPLTHEIQAVFELDGLRLPDGPRLRVVSWSQRDL
jgi:general secretion pathway protein K